MGGRGQTGEGEAIVKYGKERATEEESPDLEPKETTEVTWERPARAQDPPSEVPEADGNRRLWD